MREKEPDIIQRTRKFWQLHYEEELTEEDAREIIKNITGFFATLARWDQQSNDGQDSDNGDE